MRHKYIRKNAIFGAIRKPGFTQRHPTRSANIKIIFSSHWLTHAIPVDSQGDTNACVGFATANWIEAMIRRHIGHDQIQRDQQIDAIAIWRAGREMFWPREPVADGGLWLDQGIKAAVAIGALPPGTTPVKITDNTFASLSKQLVSTPFLMAQATHNAWNNPSKENGFIEYRRGDHMAGHAILGVAMLKQKGKPFLMLQNSWLPWGWNGFGIMSETHFQKNMLSECYTCRLPDGWQDYDGWRKHLIRPRV